MDRQDLFDQTVRRLAEIVTDDFAAYSALEASALVRKLLIDGSPLLHQVNRQRRKRIAFEVAGNAAYEALVMEDKPVFYAPGGSLSPRLALGMPFQVTPMNLDQFLAHRALYVNGHEITVRQVVLQLANVEGGVHAGTPNTEAEKLLNEVNTQLGIGGMGSVAYSMQAIALMWWWRHSNRSLARPSFKMSPSPTWVRRRRSVKCASVGTFRRALTYR
jgi:hypothetical protein